MDAKKLIGALAIVAVLFSCKEAPKNWQLTDTVTLDGINPIGITSTDEGVWLSDGDHNRVVLVDEAGKIVKSIDSLERPMHIAANGNELFIPLYGNDEVWRYDSSLDQHLLPSKVQFSDSLDAPAGVWNRDGEIAIADFYNNRILFGSNDEWISFGKEGKSEGDFYYPTDVQVTEDAIWVADAYNNRVQVFDKKGNFVKVIGADQKMNAATGIFVSDSEVFVTDFENDRILVFDHAGALKQELHDRIDKPTDVVVLNNRLYAVNYRNSLMNIFELKKASKTN